MRITQLITGRTSEATAAWRGVFAGARGQHRLLWYPSAGADFRDVLEMHPRRRALNRVPEVPQLYLHTDYARDLVPEAGAVVHQDDRTTVDVIESHDLQFVNGNPIHYKVSDTYVWEPGRASLTPLLRLLRVRVTSNQLGVNLAWVLYASFETFNFLAEVLLKHQIRITHLVKVRDGSDLGGGGRVCGSTLYPFLGALGVRHLLADDHVHPDRRRFDELCEHLGSAPLASAFELQVRGGPIEWSQFAVTSFAVVPRDGEMATSDLDALWTKVGRL